MSLEHDDEIEWTESEGESDNNVLDEGLFDAERDDDDDLDFDDLGGGGPRAREQQLTPEVQALYQEANQLYVQGDFAGALTILEESISIEANSKLLYNLLAAIHDDRGEVEKALMARVAAAHLDKKDKDTWIDIAERSEALGHYGQAAVFFQHVSRLARNDWTLLQKRADLHTELGQHTVALSLLQRIRTRFFAQGDRVGLDHGFKTQILLGIARAMKELGRIDEATAIYLTLFHRSVGDDASHEPPEVELDWQNLNILSELLYAQLLFAEVIVMIKNGARWILGRGHEKFWNRLNAETDAEFDDRRFMLAYPGDARRTVPLSDNLEQYMLPIDIRIWLLECRLKQIPTHMLLNARTPAATIESLPCVIDALFHLDNLKEHQPVESYSDLYKRAAVALFHARLYSHARELYVLLTDIGHATQEEYLEMTVQVAKCEMELHNTQRAEELYKFVLDKDEANQEALVALGEIYAATSRAEDSRRILVQLEAVRQRSASVAPEPEDTVRPAISGGSMYVDDSLAGRSRGSSARPTRAERAEVERVAQQRADAAFAGLSRFQSGLEAGNAVALMEWLRFADELVDMFASHRKFFPTNRQKEFFSFDGSSNSTVDERIARLMLANEPDEGEPDAAADSDDQNKDPALTGQLAGTRARDRMEESYIWRGQPLSTWFIVLMRCALVHAKSRHGQRASEVVHVAQAANVYRLNSERNQTMSLVELSCAYVANNDLGVSDILRHMYMQRQFSPTIFKLYGALFPSGGNAIINFASSNNQKFFLRQIKALDSVLSGKRISGASKVVDADRAPKHEDPQLFMLYAYMMLLGPSYTPALTYLMRAREHLPKSPVLLLCLGIVQMQRSIQRVTPNRHLQLLEGLSYMQDYAQVRAGAAGGVEDKVEVNYNLGRFFHGVGLLTIATRYYERALSLCKQADSAFNVGREAAYNLQLIYACSGNMRLSAAVIDEYLTI